MVSQSVCQSVSLLVFQPVSLSVRLGEPYFSTIEGRDFDIVHNWLILTLTNSLCLKQFLERL